MSEAIIEAASLTRLGIRHGFTTRSGGVSQGPFAALNLSGNVGDDPSAVAQNRRAFEKLCGLAWSGLIELQQVHGTDVLRVDRPAADYRIDPAPRCDASITDRADVVLSVRTADCQPILIVCPRRRAAAAVHAGWRGSLAGVARAAIEALIEAYGCRPTDLVAVLGPCIRAAAFEVGPEVFTPFEAAFGPTVAQRRGRSLHVDLAAANRIWLERAGLSPAKIEDLGLCTHADAARFFSHRRDQGRTGRQLAFVCLAPIPGWCVGPRKGV